MKTQRMITTEIISREPRGVDAEGRERSGGVTARQTVTGPLTVELTDEELDRALVAEALQAAATMVADSAETIDELRVCVERATASSSISTGLLEALSRRCVVMEKALQAIAQLLAEEPLALALVDPARRAALEQLLALFRE